jgi:hypothetical protein
MENMSRWLIFAAILLLICSLVGDVFIIHHHLNGFSPEADHTPPEYFSFGYAAAFFVGFALIGSVYLSTSRVKTSSSKLTRQFCGWHSSAYLEDQVLMTQV